MVTRAAAPAAETVEWARSAAMAQLPTDGARSGLATVPHATLVAVNGHQAQARHILGQGNLDDTITVVDIREGLVTAPGDGMHFPKGGEELFDDIVRNLRRAVAQINEATPGVSTHHPERDITEADSRRQNTTTIKCRLESNPNSTIAKELHGGEGVLGDGLQQLRQNR